MIKGNKINLRLLKETELEAYVKLTEDVYAPGEFWLGDPPSLNKIKSNFANEGFWSEKGWHQMVITDKKDNFLGEIFYFKPTSYLEGYEIGYRIFSQDNYGKGYATEALSLFSKYLFDLKNIRRIQVGMAEENIGSKKVAEKCGFTYEGKFRQAFFVGGKHRNMLYFSKLRDEL